jgi:hypothetical protein
VVVGPAIAKVAVEARGGTVLHRAGQRLTVPIPWQLNPPPSEQAGGAHRLAPYVNGLALSLIAAATLAGTGYAPAPTPRALVERGLPRKFLIYLMSSPRHRPHFAHFSVHTRA